MFPPFPFFVDLSGEYRLDCQKYHLEAKRHPETFRIHLGEYIVNTYRCKQYIKTNTYSEYVFEYIRIPKELSSFGTPGAVVGRILSLEPLIGVTGGLWAESAAVHARVS